MQIEQEHKCDPWWLYSMDTHFPGHNSFQISQLSLHIAIFCEADMDMNSLPTFSKSSSLVVIWGQRLSDVFMQLAGG